MISEALGLKPLMGERKQKMLSTLIVSFGAFFGFEALAFVLETYQVADYLWVAIYVYLFHIFWLTFVYDLHLKNRGILAWAHLDKRGMAMLNAALKDRVAHVFRWDYFRHYQNFLILPGLLYWSVVILMFLNPFNQTWKQGIVVLGSSCMTIIYWHMKEFFNRKMESHELSVKVFGLTKVFAAFFIFSAVFGLTRYYGFGLDFLLPAVFVATFALLYQALFQHRLLTFNMYFLIVIISAITSTVGLWLYFYWNWNYLTAGLVILSVYNSLWGMIHHYMEKSLTKKLAVEYAFVMLLAVSLILASHNFGPRVL